MKTPATPTATAARARTGTNSRWPPDDVPCPPGCCTECVASKITGAPVSRRRIGSARICAGGGAHRAARRGGGGRGGRRSDVALKHDIIFLGRLDNGLGFYRFSYNGSNQ